MWLNQNVIVVMGVEKLNTFMFFFYLYSPGSSDKASLNQQLKLCHENWKFDKTNTSPLKKNKLLTLKGLSLSPTLFKVLLQNPEKPHAAPRGLPIQHDLNRNIRPLLRRSLQQDWVDRLRMQGGGRRRWETVSHTVNCQKGNTIWQTDKWPIIHLFLFFLFFFFNVFFPFCCLHNETPCIGWEIQKRTSSGKWWSQMCNL